MMFDTEPQIDPPVTNEEKAIAKRYELMERLEDAFKRLDWLEVSHIDFYDEDRKMIMITFDVESLGVDELEILLKISDITDMPFTLDEGTISIDYEDDYGMIDYAIAVINKYLEKNNGKGTDPLNL